MISGTEQNIGNKRAPETSPERENPTKKIKDSSCTSSVFEVAIFKKYTGGDTFYARDYYVNNPDAKFPVTKIKDISDITKTCQCYTSKYTIRLPSHLLERRNSTNEHSNLKNEDVSQETSSVRQTEMEVKPPTNHRCFIRPETVEVPPTGPMMKFTGGDTFHP